MNKALLFDLDGTLLDTARDMLHALHLLAGENGIDIHPCYDSYKELITRGSKAIVASVFGNVSEKSFLSLQQRYLDIYQSNLTAKTCFFNGIKEVISHLQKNDIPWGVVTNKPYYLSAPLIQSMQEFQSSGVLIGGDSTPHSKPHPHPLLEAAREIKVPAAEICYVGDAESDIQAARAANMKSAVATWGYLRNEDRPSEWGADWILKDPGQLLRLI